MTLKKEKSNARSCPSQFDCNCLASFIEAAEELKQEPFFSPDNRTALVSTGNEHTAQFGDRFHFRSALVTFRRMWLNDEASNFLATCKLIERYEGEHFWVGLCHDIYNKETARKLSQLDMTSGKIVDLWLNGVFAHSNLKRKGLYKNWHDRIDFEMLCRKVRKSWLEFIFRTTVQAVGRCAFIQLLEVARPTLEKWERTYGLKPEFEIGFPFGAGTVEKESDGWTIIRKASTEHLGNESARQRFNRILSRNYFQGLSGVVKALIRFGVLTFSQVLEASSFREIIERAEYDLTLLPKMNWQDFYKQMEQGDELLTILPIHEWSPVDKLGVVLTSKRELLTTSETIRKIDQQLQRFHAEYK